jgi:hypothetical protein
LNTPLTGAILNPFTFSIGSGSVTQPLVTGTLLDSIQLSFNDTALPTATTSQTLQLIEQVTGADGFRVASPTTVTQINFSENDRDYLLTITPNGGNWVQGQSGGAHNVTATVLLTDVTPIPEPTEIALAGSGLLLIVFIMRGRLGTRLLAPATVKA